jgi:SAM-dependent methyltransferase
MPREVLYEIYWKVRSFLAPSLEYAQFFYEEALFNQVTGDKFWLDLGCGHQLLSPWRQSCEDELVSQCRHVTGLDLSHDALRTHPSIRQRVTGDISHLPFNAQSFDLVTANMVVEHLADPLGQFCEIRRVLKPGGRFVFHTPNAWGYFGIGRRLMHRRLNYWLISLLDGRPREDVFPIQYKANTAARIAKIACMSGFKVQRIRMIVSSPVFAIVPPLMIVELLWLRLLMLKPFKRWRTNIIAELKAC